MILRAFLQHNSAHSAHLCEAGVSFDAAKQGLQNRDIYRQPGCTYIQ